ncbi:hypothetical protein COOONC_26432 [Cooperia oncophora]
MRFTLNTALKAAEQCLICIEELHRIGFLHRDIKPGNFAIGRPEANEHHIIFMLDFGLCRKYQEKVILLHVFAELKIVETLRLTAGLVG